MVKMILILCILANLKLNSTWAMYQAKIDVSQSSLHQKSQTREEELKATLVRVLEMTEWCQGNLSALAEASNLIKSVGIGRAMGVRSNSSNYEAVNRVDKLESMLATFLRLIDEYQQPKGEPNEPSTDVFVFHEIFNLAHRQFDIPLIPMPQSIRDQIKFEEREREQMESDRIAALEEEWRQRSLARDRRISTARAAGTLLPMQVEGREVKVGDRLRIYFKPNQGLFDSDTILDGVIDSMDLDPKASQQYPNSNRYSFGSNNIPESLIDFERTVFSQETCPNRIIFSRGNVLDYQ